MLVVFCLQGRSPVNLPDYPYNTQDICSPTDLAQFVQQSREMAARLTKSRQSSRLTLACSELLPPCYPKNIATVFRVTSSCPASASAHVNSHQHP